MNEKNTSDEQPETGPEGLAETTGTDAAPDDVAPPAPAYAELTQPATDPAARRWLPSTPAGTSRLVMAGVAGAFLLGGGLGGYAIGQAGEDHDRDGMVRPADFDGRGPGGPDGGMRGGPGGQQGRQAPGSTSGSGTPS